MECPYRYDFAGASFSNPRNEGMNFIRLCTAGLEIPASHLMSQIIQELGVNNSRTEKRRNDFATPIYIGGNDPTKCPLPKPMREKQLDYERCTFQHEGDSSQCQPFLQDYDTCKGYLLSTNVKVNVSSIQEVLNKALADRKFDSIAVAGSLILCFMVCAVVMYCIKSKSKKDEPKKPFQEPLMRVLSQIEPP